MKLITSTVSIIIATLVVIQSYLGEASSQCIVHSYWQPVCGTNNVTYVNAGHLECLKRTVPGLEKWYDGECAANPITTTTTGMYPNDNNRRQQWRNNNYGNRWEDWREDRDDSFEIKIGGHGPGHGMLSKTAGGLLLAQAIGKHHGATSGTHHSNFNPYPSHISNPFKQHANPPSNFNPYPSHIQNPFPQQVNPPSNFNPYPSHISNPFPQQVNPPSNSYGRESAKPIVNKPAFKAPDPNPPKIRTSGKGKSSSGGKSRGGGRKG